MDFLCYSNLNPLLILFSFGIIGGIFSFIGAIGRGIWGGAKDKVTATQKIDYQKVIDEQKRDFEKQMTLQAQESKKTMMMIGIGGGVIVFILIMFMMIRKK